MNRNLIFWFLVLEGVFCCSCALGWSLGYNSKDWVVPMAILFSLGLLSLLAAAALWKTQAMRRQAATLAGIPIAILEHFKTVKAYGKQPPLFQEQPFKTELVYCEGPPKTWSVDQPAYILVHNLQGEVCEVKVSQSGVNKTSKSVNPGSICKLYLDKDHTISFECLDHRSSSILLTHLVFNRTGLD